MESYQDEDVCILHPHVKSGVILYGKDGRFRPLDGRMGSDIKDKTQYIRVDPDKTYVYSLYRDTPLQNSRKTLTEYLAILEENKIKPGNKHGNMQKVWNYFSSRAELISKKAVVAPPLTTMPIQYISVVLVKPDDLFINHRKFSDININEFSGDSERIY
jgi:hypothetical protein